MPRATLITATATLLTSAGIAMADVVDTRELEESIPVAAGQPLVVIVKNVTGSVHVTEHDRDSVEMHASETIRGDMQADIERARAQLSLRTETEPGRVAFRVRRAGADDSWDADGDCDCDGWRWGDNGYHVEYDIELRVPRGATLDLTTVNDGAVVAENVTGDFTFTNVNGEIKATGLAGSGRVKTVNGDVEATFARTPAAATSFHTVNGDLDVTLPNDLAADLEFKTLHGDVFTDFELEPLARPATVNRESARGRYVMSGNRSTAFRVQTGGEQLSFHTLNGDIYVRKANR